MEELELETKTPLHEKYIGEELLPFGTKLVHMPSLIRGFLSLRTQTKNYCKGRPLTAISNSFKNLMMDIIFKDKFVKSYYDELSDEEKQLFDDICRFARYTTHATLRLKTYSIKTKEEQLARFNELKDKLMTGDSSKEILQEMRNILLDLKAKNLIPRSFYDTLIKQIVLCL